MNESSEADGKKKQRRLSERRPSNSEREQQQPQTNGAKMGLAMSAKIVSRFASGMAGAKKTVANEADRDSPTSK